MKKFGKAIVFLAALLLVLALMLLFNTLNFKSKQVIAEAVDPIPIRHQAVQNFSKALTIETVSPEDPADFDSTAFHAFSAFLEHTYPLTDSILGKKRFGAFSFLYRWEGSQPDQAPIVLMAHLDVVPASANDRKNWKAPPFGGIIREDTLWGRGALDDKIGVISMLEAVEFLVSNDFNPTRTIYLALGHDEETGGFKGAAEIADFLKDQGVKAEFILDEGGAITQGMVPGTDAPVALIGIAEKGTLSLEITVRAAGGHASMPERETPIDILGGAISKLKSHPFPARMHPALKATVEHLGPEMSFLNKLAFANASFLEPFLVGAFQQTPSGNAQVRTTIAPTLFRSGVKGNVLPQEAVAVVNFRILPGETVASVTDRVKRTIDDERIRVFPRGFSNEPSGISSPESFGYRTLTKTIREVFPGVIVAPNLLVGATDSRHFRDLTDDIFRFRPIPMNRETIQSVHGVNERVPVRSLEEAIRFYVRLIRNTTS